MTKEEKKISLRTLRKIELINNKEELLEFDKRFQTLKEDTPPKVFTFINKCIQERFKELSSKSKISPFIENGELKEGEL